MLGCAFCCLKGSHSFMLFPLSLARKEGILKNKRFFNLGVKGTCLLYALHVWGLPHNALHMVFAKETMHQLKFIVFSILWFCFEFLQVVFNFLGIIENSNLTIYLISQFVINTVNGQGAKSYFLILFTWMVQFLPIFTQIYSLAFHQLPNII